MAAKKIKWPMATALGTVIAIAVGLSSEGFAQHGAAVETIDTMELVTISDVEGVDAEDIPEEILRTEIITEARSPITGEPLSAAEYAQLRAELAAPAGDTLLSQDARRLVFLLQLRRAVQPILPFF